MGTEGIWVPLVVAALGAGTAAYGSKRQRDVASKAKETGKEQEAAATRGRQELDTTQSQSDENARRLRVRRALGGQLGGQTRGGRGGTILTSPLGDVGGAISGGKSLLGG